jgi:hypothetical protein
MTLCFLNHDRKHFVAPKYFLIQKELQKYLDAKIIPPARFDLPDQPLPSTISINVIQNELDGLLVPPFKACCNATSIIFDDRRRSYAVLPHLWAGNQYVTMAFRGSDLHLLSLQKGPRKTQSGNAVVKCCSDRCRHNKPGRLDRKIEDSFVALLEGEGTDAVNSDGDATKCAEQAEKESDEG